MKRIFIFSSFQRHGFYRTPRTSCKYVPTLSGSGWSFSSFYQSPLPEFIVDSWERVQALGRTAYCIRLPINSSVTYVTINNYVTESNVFDSLNTDFVRHIQMRILTHVVDHHKYVVWYTLRSENFRRICKLSGLQRTFTPWSRRLVHWTWLNYHPAVEYIERELKCEDSDHKIDVLKLFYQLLLLAYLWLL